MASSAARSPGSPGTSPPCNWCRCTPHGGSGPLGTPPAAGDAGVGAAGDAVDAAGDASGSPPCIAGRGPRMHHRCVCSGLGTRGCRNGDPYGSSRLCKALCSCLHNPCSPAGGLPNVGVLHTAPRTHSRGGGSPCCGAGMGVVLVEEMCLAEVDTGSDGGEGGGLCEVGSLVGEMCAGPEVGGRYWAEAHGEAGVVVVRGWSDGDEVEVVEEVDDGQFQCGDGGVEVADCGDGVMKLIVMTEGGVVVGAVCGEVGD